MRIPRTLLYPLVIALVAAIASRYARTSSHPSQEVSPPIKHVSDYYDQAGSIPSASDTIEQARDTVSNHDTAAPALDIKTRLRTDPWVVIAELKAVVEDDGKSQHSTTTSTKAAAADQLGDAYLLLQDHENSVKWYQRGLDMRLAANKAAKKLAKKTGAEVASPVTDSQLILSYASLSHALRQALKLSEAGTMAEKALAIANKASNHHIVPPAVMSMLLTLQSGIAECEGDYVTALLKIEQSLKVAPPTDLEHVRMHLDLLRRVVSSEQHRMPAQVAAQMTSRADKIVEFLLTQGYEHRDQFPKYYVPNLEALAWHDLDSVPGYAAAIELLRAATHALRDEYATLRDNSLLSPERE